MCNPLSDRATACFVGLSPFSNTYYTLFYFLLNNDKYLEREYVRMHLRTCGCAVGGE
jgi:hypothetical protein